MSQYIDRRMDGSGRCSADGSRKAPVVPVTASVEVTGPVAGAGDGLLAVTVAVGIGVSFLVDSD
jgi:hypothetical protein